MRRRRRWKWTGLRKFWGILRRKRRSWASNLERSKMWSWINCWAKCSNTILARGLLQMKFCSNLFWRNWGTMIQNLQHKNQSGWSRMRMPSWQLQSTGSWFMSLLLRSKLWKVRKYLHRWIKMTAAFRNPMFRLLIGVSIKNHHKSSSTAHHPQSFKPVKDCLSTKTNPHQSNKSPRRPFWTLATPRSSSLSLSLCKRTKLIKNSTPSKKEKRDSFQLAHNRNTGIIIAPNPVAVKDHEPLGESALKK